MRDNQESKKGTRRTWVEFDPDVYAKLGQLAKIQDKSISWLVQSVVRESLGFPPKP